MSEALGSVPSVSKERQYGKEGARGKAREEEEQSIFLRPGFLGKGAELAIFGLIHRAQHGPQAW